MTKRIFFTSVAALALAIFAGGCGSNSNSSSNSAGAGEGASAGSSASSGGSGGSGASSGEAKKLTIGYLPNIVIPQPLVGLQNGDFARALPGVALDSKTFPAGPAVMEALRGGVVDIAYTGPYPPLKGFIKDGDIVLLTACAEGGTELLVGQNSPIKSVKDLKGKIVAVNQIGSTVDAMVRHVLLQAGLKPGVDVTVTAIEPAQQADALQNGEVAAASAPAPWPSVAKQKGARALLDWKQILDNGKYLQGVAFTTTKFAQANPNLIKAFVAAHRKITDDLNANRAKGDAQVLAAWQTVTRKALPPAVAQAAFKTITFTNESSLASWNRVQEIAQEVGILRKTGDLKGFLYQAM